MAPLLSVSLHAVLYLPQDEAFARLSKAAEHNEINGFRYLGSQHHWGPKDAIGQRRLVRVALDLFDYHHVETLLRYDPPAGLTVEQRPEKLTRFDPAERLPPVGSSDPGDPDAAFRSLFGKFPQPTRLTLDLVPNRHGTGVTLTAARPQEGLAWWKRPLWTRSTARQLKGWAEGGARGAVLLWTKGPAA